MKRILSSILLLWCFLSMKAEVGMLDAAYWICMEPVDTVVAPLVHAPFAKQVFGDRRIEYSLPQFMKTFRAKKNVQRATLYVCGLGHFNVYLDGTKVGDHFMDPGWTMYDKEALYVAFDVTRQLQETPDNVVADFAQRFKRDEHMLVVELGNGFYNVPKGRYNKLIGSYGQPKLRLRLLIEYKTGQDDNIVTDESWVASPSQTTFSSVYAGEEVDLRIKPEWRAVRNLWYDGPKLSEQQGTEVVVWGQYKPVDMWQAANGDWVYDMGQNMSGIMQATLTGSESKHVEFIPAELKKADGSVNNKHQGNWRFGVTLRDDKEVTVEPKFTYTGFRYIQVSGAVPAGKPNPEGLPVLKELIAKHTTSATAREEAGSFTCNSEFFNQVHHLVDWAIRSNLQSVITDCPHREKLGWLEQDHLMMPSMYYRYDLAPLYRKIMNDMEASQFQKGQTLGLAAPSTPWINENHDLEGMMPTIAPCYTNFGWNFDDTPEWGSAFIISPWHHYQWTGSDELFREHFPAMQRYIDYLSRRARKNGYLLEYGLGDWYDLGPNKPGYAQLTSQGITATATYYYDVKLMAEMARVLALGEGLDTSVQISSDGYRQKGTKKVSKQYSSIEMLGLAQQYDALADSIKQAYNTRFLHAEGYYDKDSQCANAISLFMGLVPEEQRASVMQHIADDVRGRISAIDNNDNTRYDWGENGKTILTAGDVGFRYLLMALAEAGEHQLIGEMLCRDDVPGYGMQLKKGATALTESWQALESVSNNHLMLGHILEWMYGYLGGLRQAPGSVGWKEVLVAPHPVADVTDCTVTYKTPLGPVKVHWWIENQMCKIQYTAPRSMKVTVINPAEELSKRAASL